MSCYAVKFSSKRTDDDNGYPEMATRLLELAEQQEGFIGLDTARDAALGITVSYWKLLEAIKKLKQNSEHLIAQELGKEKWYSSFHIRIAKVESEYSFKNG